jgi:hypothetical protein
MKSTIALTGESIRPPAKAPGAKNLKKLMKKPKKARKSKSLPSPT